MPAKAGWSGERAVGDDRAGVGGAEESKGKVARALARPKGAQKVVGANVSGGGGAEKRDSGGRLLVRSAGARALAVGGGERENKRRARLGKRAQWDGERGG